MKNYKQPIPLLFMSKTKIGRLFFFRLVDFIIVSYNIVVCELLPTIPENKLTFKLMDLSKKADFGLINYILLIVITGKLQYVIPAKAKY